MQFILHGFFIKKLFKFIL